MTGEAPRPGVAKGSLRDGRRWLLGFVAPERPRLALVLALSLAASLLALAQPWITKHLIDDGLVAGDFGIVAALCGVMFAAAVCAAVLSAVNRWHYVTASSRILFALRSSVFRHLQRLSPAFFAKVRGGDLMARLDGDLAELQRFAVDSTLALINGVIVLAGALVLMLALSWQLSLIAFALLPLQILLLRALRPRIEDRTRDLRSRASGISSFFFERLSAMKFIQSIGGEAREAKALDSLQDGYLRSLLRLQMLNQGATALPSLLTLVGTIAVFLAGGAMVIDGALSLGTLIAFTAYLARASGPVHTLLGLWVALKRAEVSLERIREITDEAPAVRQPAQPRPLPDGRGALRLERVSFAHGSDSGGVNGSGDGGMLLRDVTATFPAGRKVAVLGASGAGKTTLIDLLQRHYDPAAGHITLDGVDLRDLELGGLRRRIAVVAQDTVLLHGSIAENIRYAVPEADQAAVEEAARRAGAADFIAALPEGYQTEAGSRGFRLSGGQRQRIALARAFLLDPLVLILDEATSGVDSETEAAIRVSLDDLFADRTRIIVSHRSHLTADADLVFHLAGGDLVLQASAGAEPAT